MASTLLSERGANSGRPQPSDSGTSGAVSPSPERTRGEAGRPEPIRVVVADDSAAIRTLARYALSPARGFSVIAEAADGTEALAMVESHQPDCIVLDIEMPGMGGFETLAELRRRGSAVAVVMLSGFSDEAVTARALAGGAAAYLDKSSHLTSLAATVHRVTSGALSAHAEPNRVDPDPAPGVALTDKATAGSSATSGSSVTGAASPSSPAAAASAPTTPATSTASTALSASATGCAAPAAAISATSATSAATEQRRFEYVVSHDLAEPLRVMAGFSTLLQTRYGPALDESGQTFLAHIVDGAGRMQAMLDDLLLYSRAGCRAADLALLDTADQLAPLRDRLAQILAARGALLEAGPLPSAIADPAMLAEVLRQLVLNGLTFNAAAVPTVKIDGSVVGSRALLTISDNGIGVAAAHRERVFDLFQRLNTRDEYPGTGTGLALCRRLMTLQGGTVELGPGADGGTTVTLSLAAHIDIPGGNT